MNGADSNSCRGGATPPLPPLPSHCAAAVTCAAAAATHAKAASRNGVRSGVTKAAPMAVAALTHDGDVEMMETCVVTGVGVRTMSNGTTATTTTTTTTNGACLNGGGGAGGDRVCAEPVGEGEEEEDADRMGEWQDEGEGRGEGVRVCAKPLREGEEEDDADGMGECEGKWQGGGQGQGGGGGCDACSRVLV